MATILYDAFEKGIEYRFGTEPYLETVEYSAVDDLGVGEPMAASLDSTNGVWIPEGGGLYFSLPSLLGYGYCAWYSPIVVTPSALALWDTSNDMTFTARLADYRVIEPICKLINRERHIWR